MLNNGQLALKKAHDFIYTNSQVLPEDYFDSEDEDDAINGSFKAISGFFSKIKNSYQESKKNGKLALFNNKDKNNTSNNNSRSVNQSRDSNSNYNNKDVNKSIDSNSNNNSSCN